MTASLSRLQSFYGDLEAPALLHVMTQIEFPGKIALLTSFGSDAAPLLAMTARIDPATPVLFLDTQKHFPETLDYARRLTDTLGLSNVRWIRPDPLLAARTDPSGTLWQTQPNRCCWLRKVEPLNRAITEGGYVAIITGRKRYQTKERADLQTIELDENNIFRINPLAHWTRVQLEEETAKRNLPPHPLVAKGYKSIGCEPCTLPIADGADERAGRWAHTIGFENEQKTECGIHVPAAATNWSV